MRLTLIILVAILGIVATIGMAIRLWRAARSGAPRELQLGYLAIMVGVGAVSLLLLRAL